MNSAWFPTDNPYIVYRIETTILSQSIINNTSTVRVRMFAKRTNAYSPGTQGHGTFYVTINGTEYSEYHNHVDEGVIINSTGIYVFSKTLTIPHNNDGTKTLATAGRINYSRFTATSHSASFTLTPIPRSTFPTFDASSVEMGEDVTIMLNAASADYTHDLEWSYNGGAFTLIEEDVESPYSWTVPDLTNYVTDSDRTNIVIRVTTHNGDTVMGQQTGVFSAVVPLDVVPVVNNPTATELTEGIAEQFDAFIQTKSAIRFSLSASGFRGSTIVGYSANFNNANYGGQTFDTPVIEVGGEIPLTVTATDSRGRSATRVIPITVIPFSTPTLSAFSVQRVDQLHNPDDSGDYIAIKLNYNVPSLNGGNTADISIGSRKTVEGGSFTEFYSSSVLSQNTTIYPAQIFSSDYQLDFQIEIDDYFGNKVTATGYVPGGEVVLDIGTDGDRISFFKTAECGGFEIKNGKPFYTHGLEIIPLIQSLIPPFPDFLSKFKAGRVSITPQAKEATSHHVTFDQPFDHVPQVMVTPVTSVPYTIVRYVTANNVTATGFDIVIYRENATSTGVMWFAVDLMVDEPIMIEIPDITQDAQTGAITISGTREIEQGSETEPVVEQDEQTGIVSIT